MRKISRTHRGKRNGLTETQRNQRNALKYYIKISAYEDEIEIVNTHTVSENQWVLNKSFGVVDSGVLPSYAFDGCVMVDKRLRG